MNFILVFNRSYVLILCVNILLRYTGIQIKFIEINDIWQHLHIFG